MNNFLFEGDYRRRPVQNLGGRSRDPEDRNAVLRNAELERQRRKNERARASAGLVLQAAFRGMRDRKMLNVRYRADFAEDTRVEYDIVTLECQILRLNYFFKVDKDQQLLCDLGKSMLKLSDELMSRMLEEDRSLLRVLHIMEKALQILPDVQPQHKSTMLRILEIFTCWEDFNTIYQKKHPNLPPVRVQNMMANIWVNLVLRQDFFEKYRLFLDTRFDIPHAEVAHSVLLRYDYSLFYKRFLYSLKQLWSSQRQYIVGQQVYENKELIHGLLRKLAESCMVNILRFRGEKKVNGMLRYVVIPRVAVDLAEPVDEGGHNLWDEFWLDVLTHLADSFNRKDDPVNFSVKTRSILFGFLTQMSFVDRVHTRPLEVLRTISVLIPSLDNRRNIFVMPAEDQLSEEEEDEDGAHGDSDVQMRATEEVKLAIDFFADRDTIYTELQRVMNDLKLQLWIHPFQVSRWNILYPVLNILIGMEPLKATLDFRFLSGFYNNASFMRACCIHVLRKEQRDRREMTVFCWLLQQLMKILHDGEFMIGVPMNRNELLHFIHLLLDVYTDIILGDKDVTDKEDNCFKQEISRTLMAIHDRNTRINIFSEDSFVSSKLRVLFPMETHNIRFADFYNPQGRNNGTLSMLDQRLLRVLNDFPFCLSFHDRISIWQQLLHSDHVERHVMDDPFGRQHIQIRRNYIYEDAYEKLSQENVPDLRADIRISLVNVVGTDEAGVDGGGLLREFLIEATKAGIDPNRGLFRVDSQNRIYPNPIAKKIVPDYMRHHFLIGRLVGKALYHQILLELPLAAFFMQLVTFGSVSSAVDYLATLDPDLHKNLLKLRTYSGDWTELGLDFTLASDELGETRVIELKPGGRNISVDQSNVIEYIHLVADYKINREIMQECRWFRHGLQDVVPVLKIFSWKEMQTLISGSDKPINVTDWMANTNYAGGYTENHATIQMFWDVVKAFDEKYLRKLLKFVTSCSRPPLLGFKDLVPKFGISNAGVNDRLPTAATCMNLLKLPEFTDIDILRERLVYAITAQAGFELS